MATLKEIQQSNSERGDIILKSFGVRSGEIEKGGKKGKQRSGAWDRKFLFK